MDDHKAIESILSKALDNASSRSHEYVTLEHITIELLKTKPILKMIEELKIDHTQILNALDEYIDSI